MEFIEWAKRHNISLKALSELEEILGTKRAALKKEYLISEKDLQEKIKLEASKKGARLWRNNVGATYTENKQFIRFGLANESSYVNQKIKSSDLIGIRPVLITEIHLGKILGQFMCREVKKPGWKFTGNEREQAQLMWLLLINSLGGDAKFATDDKSI